MVSRLYVKIFIVFLAAFVCISYMDCTFAKTKKAIKKTESVITEIETTGVAGSNDSLVLFEEDITKEVEKEYSNYTLEKKQKN